MVNMFINNFTDSVKTGMVNLLIIGSTTFNRERRYEGRVIQTEPEGNGKWKYTQSVHQ